MEKYIDTETLIKNEKIDKSNCTDENGNLLEVGKDYDIETCEPEIFIRVKFLGWKKEYYKAIRLIDLKSETNYIDEGYDIKAIFQPLENLEISGGEMYYLKPELIKE